MKRKWVYLCIVSFFIMGNKQFFLSRKQWKSKVHKKVTEKWQTCSPYFSPNIAIAPALLASVKAITFVWRCVASATHPLINSSITISSCSKSGRWKLKSNRRRSNATKEPACEISCPITLLSAACSKWVAVWWTWN